MLTSNETKIIKLIGFEYGVKFDDIFKKTNKRKIVLCRKIATIVFIEIGYKPSRIKEIFKIHSMTCRYYINFMSNNNCEKIKEIINYIKSTFTENDKIPLKDFVLNNQHLTGKYIANKYNKSVIQVQNIRAYNTFKNKQ